MGIADFFSDLYSSMGFPEAHADAPPEDDNSKEEGGDDDKSEGEGDEEGGEAGGDEEGGEEEPEEEEEEEPVDPKPKLEEGELAGAIHFQFRFASG
jgi:ubiquinol-cytochrome c reductase subunit 6